MRLIFLTAALLFASFSGRAAELPDADAAVRLSDEIMQKASAGDYKAAFALAEPYVVIPKSELDALLGKVELQSPMLIGRFGKSVGYELLRNDTAGGSLIRVAYLHKFEKHGLIWRFIFYRKDSGWVLNTFNYVDDISVAF